MRTTILLAGLLAGLTGSAVLAQAVTAPEAETPQPGTAAPESAAPEMVPTGPMGEGGFGVPGLAPLELYDTDGDGSVTQAEIEEGRTARFTRADADGDGALSATELLVLEDAIRQEARLARAAQVVTRMDDNGDGLLQAEEIEARTPRVAPLFDRLDADGDGGISQAEMEAARPLRGEGNGLGRGHGPRGERQGWGLSGLFGSN